MKDYASDHIRNITFIGHGGAGKTIFMDAVLLNTGAVTRIGRIEDGSTVSDYHQDEIDRQISINSTLASTEFKDVKINMLDTPGYTDFAGEVLSSLRVSDSALLFLKAVEGVEVGSELVWKYAEKSDTPVMIVVNKIDNEHADFDKVVEQAKNRFGFNVAVTQFPVKQGPAFREIIDVIRMKLLVFKGDGSGSYEEKDIPAEFQERASAAHEALVEKVAESSEDLMNHFFEQGTLTEEELRDGLRLSFSTRAIFPVFCVSASLNVGVSRVLDFIADYCPHPFFRGDVMATKPDGSGEVRITAGAKNDTVAFVFKTLSEQHVGELSLFRVYSGAIMPGLDIMNHSSGKPERINQIYVMKGKDRKEVTQIGAGDIGAVVKLKDTHTNNTLASKTLPVSMPKIVFPEPLISAAIKPKAKGDEDKISHGLHTMHEEDPSFLIQVDTETHETIVLGQGEIHLDVMMKRLKQRFGVEVDLKPPRIPYRETIRKSADVSYKHKKQTGGAGQYAEVYIRLEPKPRGEGYEFVDAIVGGVISGKFVPAVDKGIQDQMTRGVVAGYKMIDMKVTLYDGSQHTVDSNEMAFKIAAQMAFKKAVAEATPIMLEPIYQVEVTVPDEFMGDVMGDISSHRGKIQGMESEGPFQVIRAKIPLSELFAYATRLRSITQGRGVFRRSFSHYEEVPTDVMNKLIEEAAAQKEEEG
ncbi:MAG: elongation factor G [Ignavibacteriae bacterium]|nr:elongation factor G [Ignavibacteriota bacterium]